MRRLLDRLVRMFRPTAPVGDRAERAAGDYLTDADYRILARNWANRFGEIDLIAETPDGHTVVVVEVKAREVTPPDDDPYHRPEDRVGSDKQRRLTALAGQAARHFQLTDRPIRFDVIGVDLDPADGAVINLRHHPGAFESSV
ncbi:MAG: YraN family protein [Phycisphaeraceae bacterium]|nr:YraN family protein [Phycisphaeraceae bacterium]